MTTAVALGDLVERHILDCTALIQGLPAINSLSPAFRLASKLARCIVQSCSVLFCQQRTLTVRMPPCPAKDFHLSHPNALAVKEGVEKDAFFKRLPSALPNIPPPVAHRKLLPLLSRALEYGGAPPSAVGSLLLISKGLSPETFTKRVVPCLSKLFASSDRTLRRHLLEAVDVYAPMLTTVRQ